MADTKISGLAAGAALGSADVFAAVQGGATVKVTGAQLAALGRANPVEQVAFSPTPALEGVKAMPQQLVSGVIAFTAPATKVLGATNYVRLVADGVNAPTFSGLIEHGYSSSYLNVAGAVNHIAFWYDGQVCYYAVSQVANVSPFAAASGFLTANSFGFVFPYNLDPSSVPAAAAFTVTASGGAATASSPVIAGQTCTLTLSRAIAPTETATASYAPPGTSPLIDYNGNAVLTSALPAASVENAVLNAGEKFIALSTLNGWSQIAHPSGGYDYAPSTNVAYSGGYYAFSPAAIPAGADGFFEMQLSSAGANGLLLGLNASATPPSAYTGLAYYFFCNGTVYSFGAGTAGTALAPAAKDWMRLRRTGTTVYAELSRNNRQTWTVMWTFTAASSTALYPTIMGGGNTVQNVGLRAMGSTNVA